MVYRNKITVMKRKINDILFVKLYKIYKERIKLVFSRKKCKKISILIVLLSFLAVFTSPVNAHGKPPAIAYENGKLKEGFVDRNPWESNFKSYDLNRPLFNKIEYRPFTEKEIEEFILKFQEQNKESNKNNISLLDEEFNELVEKYKKNPEFLNTELLSVQPLSMSKSWYRNEFKALAFYANAYLSLPTASSYLYHSLQDYPSNRYNYAGSSHSNAFSWTRLYTDLSIPMANQIKLAKQQGKTSTGGTTSAQTSVSNVGLDFFLTYGKIDVSWSAQKRSNSNVWDVWIVISDIYNYDKIKKISSPFPQNLIDLANNHAANAQAAGAIVPYYVVTYFEQTYTP